MTTATARRLFRDLVDSRARSGRRSRASLPVSLALHGAGVALLLALPALSPLDLPDAPASDPVAFRLPSAVPIVQAAARPHTAPPARDAATRPTAPAPALRPAAQAAPSAVPDGLPAAGDTTVPEIFDAALPFGSGCGGPGCVAGPVGPSGGDAGAGTGGGVPPGTPRVPVSGRDVSPPVKLRDVQPSYPELARRARVAGDVVIACTIAPDGRVADARVVSGPPLLDAAALAAVRQWRYRPTLLGGAPVAVSLTVTVRFRLG
jgi:protein TonB